ncbi:hypothetical protein AJ79_04243 [Helicocarpus griseus UAMH5409]|uniref:BTB domain-containing protein n=1 Tax=Helicocarpus griseus UAMH5409 TaxID=1447875 RepID=A0A2B7XU60_9EURO|nr:hypothetical protein AJ79_04243 [Helicocarpus griseus UAMH5409]
MAGTGSGRETSRSAGESSSPVPAPAEPSSTPPPTPDSSNRFASVIKYFRPHQTKARSTTISTTWPSRRFTSKAAAKSLSETNSRNKIPGDFIHSTPTTPRLPDPDRFRRPSLPIPSAVFEPALGQNIQLERRFLEYQEPRERADQDNNTPLPALKDGLFTKNFDFSPASPLSVDTRRRKSSSESPPVRFSNKIEPSTESAVSASKKMALNTGAGGQHETFPEPNATLNPATASHPAPSPVPNGQNLSSGPTNLSGLVCNVHRTTGREPRPLVGPSSTILGDKLYVFGGRLQSRNRPELLTNDMYELDLIRRHWTKLETTGDVPPPRYFHSVCALGDSKLVCYGGMSAKAAVPNQTSANPTAQQPGQEAQQGVVLLSDVHIFDVPSRTWTFIPTARSPHGRYAHCATILPSGAAFASANAPLSALHNNPSSSNPHQGSIGVEIDGHGGAEMIVVGGQDTSNHYFEEINVFNLRSLKWTSTTSLDRSCGAYRSVATPLTGVSAANIGSGVDVEGFRDPTKPDAQKPDPLLLIYSNYNFLDVKLNLQLRLPDGKLVEKPMHGPVSPPGLRFPNGGIINGHFVVSGTYLTSSKQEYAMWALDLKTLTWGRIDAGGAIFGHGSWNRGVLWSRRSTFVVMGHRKRSLVEDYNHRRINFSHICFVELEAFGLYENPRRNAPTSSYASVSSPMIPASLQAKFSQQGAGGRPLSSAAEELGRMAQSLRELSDMELLTIGGERIPVNSHILARRWGPYFIQLLRESTQAAETASDAATLRLPNPSHPSRNSSITITPSIGTGTTLVSHSSSQKSAPSLLPNLEIPSAHTLTPTSRPRTLYLPHTHLTVQLLVQYLYTSSLPLPGSPLCTPQILCSLLQLARPYQVDGLLEATVERLHQVLDGRNAAAVFNAAAMAAGGGRGTGFTSGPGGTLEVLNGVNSPAAPTEPMSTLNLNSNSSDTESGDTSGVASSSAGGAPGTSHRRTSSAQRPANLRINTSNVNSGNGNAGAAGGGSGSRNRAESVSSAASTATSASTNTSFSMSESMGTDDEDAIVGGGGGGGGHERGRSRGEREIWSGEVSSVVGLQKRGLRGLMEGRRMRERGGRSVNAAGGVSGDDGNGNGGGGGGGITQSAATAVGGVV